MSKIGKKKKWMMVIGEEYMKACIVDEYMVRGIGRGTIRVATTGSIRTVIHRKTQMNDSRESSHFQ